MLLQAQASVLNAQLVSSALRDQQSHKNVEMANTVNWAKTNVEFAPSVIFVSHSKSSLQHAQAEAIAHQDLLSARHVRAATTVLSNLERRSNAQMVSIVHLDKAYALIALLAHSVFLEALNLLFAMQDLTAKLVKQYVKSARLVISV
jgi:hypothetical protein